MIRLNLGHPNLIVRLLAPIDLVERMPLEWAGRFFKRVMPGAGPLPTWCWWWTGATTKDGYGQLRTTSKVPSMAYRVALETVLERPIHPGMEADHLCRNVKCVRPLHLQEVTKRRNLKLMRVRIKKDKRAKFVERQSRKGIGIYG